MIDQNEMKRRAALWAQGRWEIPSHINTDKFDFDWRPNVYDRPYIHQFGTQHQKTGGPRFVVPEAEGVKYHEFQRATALIDFDRWVHHYKNVTLDYTWHPDDTEPPYIYVFGNQFLSAHDCPTVEYRVPGATEYKYVDNITATLTSERSKWEQIYPIEESLWDWTWAPHPHDPPYIYVWGNEYLDAESCPTIEYHVSGATKRKYMHDRVAKLRNDSQCWKIHADIDSHFDFTWTPHPWDPPYIYVWGNQFLSAQEMPTVEYRVPGATERKYMTDSFAQLVNDSSCWKVLANIDRNTFDWTWTPHPWDPPYIYTWGNQHLDGEQMPTVEYRVPGASERKYMTDQRAVLTNDPTCWNTLAPINKGVFDWSWTPHPWDPPYIYVWGNQFLSAQEMPTVEYRVPGATERKYMTDGAPRIIGDQNCWNTLISVVDGSFDYNWCPHPWDPPYIYVWGNQWNDATTEPTVEYVVPGATEHKYMTDTVARVAADTKCWTVPPQFRSNTFDWSWRPNPHSPPQIYQWENDGPLYTVPGATEIVLMRYSDNMLATSAEPVTQSVAAIPRYVITTTLEELVAEHHDEVFWATNPDLTYDGFDFDWRPDATNFRHVNVFGNALTKDTGTYYVNGPLYKLGHRQMNYVEVQHNFSTQLTVFWVDMGTTDAAERYEALRQRYPHVIKIRYMSSWVDTINRAIKKSQTKLCWVLCSHYDYSGFDFDFYPSSWQIKQLHVFGTQHSHWGHTYLINTEVFPEMTKYVKVVEHLQNINHVRSRRARSATVHHDMLWIDFGVGAQPPQTHRTVHTTQFAGSYLDTLRNWLRSNPHIAALDNYRLWIVPSIVDHTTFDWTFTPDPFQQDQLHVFASRLGTAHQKWGDIMLLNVYEFARVMDDLQQLEDYPKKINYVGHVTAQRYPHPIIEHNNDSQVDGLAAISNVPKWPYYQLRSSDSGMPYTWVPSLWGGTHHKIMIISKGATDILVPHDVVDTVKDELYDYPRIDKLDVLRSSALLDIVFISNGEPIAEENYHHLTQTLATCGAKNRIHRVSEVSGRIASQHAAANKVNTGWYFLVNGKVRVSDTFDWSWQPDRLQRAKHYIFTVTNPVNGLEYGHQAIVANNRRLTLQTTTVTGLDFTMSSPHEVVEMNCGVALYNTDPWTTWRTAFREAVKLRNNIDARSQIRLKAWLNVGNGEYGEWSTRGAKDGVEYWRSVDGDMNELLKSYEWGWLEQLFKSKYK